MQNTRKIEVIIKELDALRVDLRTLCALKDEEIGQRFHEEVTVSLKSLAARADNMEAAVDTHDVRDGLFS